MQACDQTFRVLTHPMGPSAEGRPTASTGVRTALGSGPAPRRVPVHRQGALAPGSARSLSARLASGPGTDALGPGQARPSASNHRRGPHRRGPRRRTRPRAYRPARAGGPRDFAGTRRLEPARQAGTADWQSAPFASPGRPSAARAASISWAVLLTVPTSHRHPGPAVAQSSPASTLTPPPHIDPTASLPQARRTSATTTCMCERARVSLHSLDGIRVSTDVRGFVLVCVIACGRAGERSCVCTSVCMRAVACTHKIHIFIHPVTDACARRRETEIRFNKRQQNHCQSPSDEFLYHPSSCQLLWKVEGLSH
jgi:hypothetical protein